MATKRPSNNDTSSRAKAKLTGGGAVAQGKRAKAAGKRAVIVEGDVKARITTGDTTNYYQTFITHAVRAGASATEIDLRNAYLAWLSARANELPLMAGDGGQPLQLASVYTGMLTQSSIALDLEAPNRNAPLIRYSFERAQADDSTRLSAVAALNQFERLVLMGGPGSGKSTFLNFVALCMAGEMLEASSPNLKLLRTPLPVEHDSENKKPRPQSWSHKALLPVRVILRDFAADLPAPGTSIKADHLWNHIVKQLPEQIARYAKPMQEELLNKGGLILLDGLDEVPDAKQRREQVKQAVKEFVSLYPNCRFLVTTRTYAYQRQEWKLDGFTAIELRPFTRGQIERFIDSWYAHMVHLYRLTDSDANARAAILKRATQRTELSELAERPLLLTLMARLQTKAGGSLPENREALYAQSVDMLLDEWEGLKLRRGADNQPIVEEPSVTEWLNASRDDVRRELDKLAFNAHHDQPELVGTADIRQEELLAALVAASKNKPDARFQRLEEFLRDRAGLLSSHGDQLYQFPHRSFQEYLAACHLARFQFPDLLAQLVKADPNRWREVTLLAAARSRAVPSAIWDLVDTLCEPCTSAASEPAESAEPTQWGALIAAQVLSETGLAAPSPDLQERHERKRVRVRDWQLRLLASNILPARERALSGDLLAELGDMRIELLDVDHMQFCFVPKGEFWMGEERDDDTKLHLNPGIESDYWIGQFPVTAAQYQQFVDATGYRTPVYVRRAATNRPAETVSWHDTLAFCRWLTERWRTHLPEGWAVMLPSEVEWEKAARGGVLIPAAPVVAGVSTESMKRVTPPMQSNPLPQRAYPWGDDFDANRANTRESQVGRPSAAGCFSPGHSPYGCEDMAGNVWEWTRSLWGGDFSNPTFGYPYQCDDRKREDLGAGEEVLRVVRGGSWLVSRDFARCAVRYGDHPDGRYDGLGFRVVLRAAPVP